MKLCVSKEKFGVHRSLWCMPIMLKLDTWHVWIYYVPQYYGAVRYKRVKIVILNQLLSIITVT